MMRLPVSLSIEKEAYRPHTDEEAEHSLYDKLIHAWNHHDAAAFAKLFVAHGIAIGFDGTQLTGQKEIEKSLKEIFRDQGTARYITKVRDIKRISSDVVLLRSVAGMVPAGAYDVDPQLNAAQNYDWIARRSRLGCCSVSEHSCEIPWTSGYR